MMAVKYSCWRVRTRTHPSSEQSTFLEHDAYKYTANLQEWDKTAAGSYTKGN